MKFLTPPWPLQRPIVSCEAALGTHYSNSPTQPSEHGLCPEPCPPTHATQVASPPPPLHPSSPPGASLDGAQGPHTSRQWGTGWDTFEPRGHSAYHMGTTSVFAVAGRFNATPSRAWPPTPAALNLYTPLRRWCLALSPSESGWAVAGTGELTWLSHT